MKTRFVLLLMLSVSPAWPARSASGQDWARDLLEKAREARRLILGERPCGRPMTVKEDDWQRLAEGIEGRILHVLPDGASSGVDLRLLRIDPKVLTVRVLLSQDLGLEAATVEDFARHTGALAVTNAGYFGKDWKPLGLLVVEGKRRKPLVSRRGRQSDALYEGVFLMRGGRPVIQRAEEYQPVGEGLALQAGPLLIAGGAPAPSVAGLRDAKRVDGRLVLALDGRERIVIWAVSFLNGMNWCELRDLMLRYGEWGGDPSPAWTERDGILWALNLDGGSSAQLYVQQKGEAGKSLQVKGTAVPVALGFFARD
ncbi:MAG: phosphodiester glycosidase family protein [Candidatus Tectomicrobia bacterium]|nr:phosphodiester glycosidase family protein [Candidatus Tectomicrobia bacterium]